VRLVQKEVAIARRRFRVLVDRNDDRLDVLVAPTLSRCLTAGFLEGLAARPNAACAVISAMSPKGGL
jgi:hypothetical protein